MAVADILEFPRQSIELTLARGGSPSGPLLDPAQLQLANTLHRHLDLTELLKCFLIELQSAHPIEGIGYSPSDSAECFVAGRIGAGSLHSPLHLDGEHLGQIEVQPCGELRTSLATLLAPLAAPLRNALHHHRLKLLARRDPLTGLGNRAALDSALETELAASAQAGEQATTELKSLEERLAEALLARQSLEAEVQSLAQDRSETQQERADLEARLAEALAAMTAANADASAQMTEAERQAALLATANQSLSAAEALSAESQRQVALLNEQVTELRNQIASLQGLLDIANDSDRDSQVQIEALGSQLNTALARVAAEERRRRELEEAERVRLEAERARLEAETQNLERYRSEFFGELRQILAGQEGVQIVGDRFVFSSEVLFESGQADLSETGKQEISKVASILKTIEQRIPSTIDWVIRVDGHTDNVPVQASARFRNNWELSQARALSVVLYMIEQEGIPPNRLAANGFGEFQPINPDDTPEARAQNRRIELKLTER